MDIQFGSLVKITSTTGEIVTGQFHRRGKQRQRGSRDAVDCVYLIVNGKTLAVDVAAIAEIIEIEKVTPTEEIAQYGTAR